MTSTNRDDLKETLYNTLKKYKLYTDMEDKKTIIECIDTLIEYDQTTQMYTVKDWPTKDDFQESYAEYNLQSIELIQWCYLLCNVKSIQSIDINERNKLKKIFDANNKSYKPDRCGWMKVFNNQVKINEDPCSPSQMLNWYYVFNDTTRWEIVSVHAAYMYNKYNCDIPGLVYNWCLEFSKKLGKLWEFEPMEVQVTIPIITQKYCVAFYFIQVDNAIVYLKKYNDDLDAATREHYKSVLNKSIWLF
jgi:hypothetical protein